MTAPIGTFPVIGHETARSEILRAAQSGRMHHGWIIAGPVGIGKASLARDVALCLLTGREDSGYVPDDDPAVSLFRAGTHPDYVELRRLEKDNGDLARNISVDQVRSLGRLLATAPSLSTRRIIVIDSADDMERGAANALLKSLEEPPRNVLFFLISHAPSRLLPTIRSRCRMLRLSPLEDVQMGQVLANMIPDLSAEERDKLVLVGEGSPGRAVALSHLGVADMLETMSRIISHGDPGNKESLAVAKALALKAARPKYEAFLEQVPGFIAKCARTKQGPALAKAISAWEFARELSTSAIPLSLDPSATVFELCGFIASLSESKSATTV